MPAQSPASPGIFRRLRERYGERHWLFGRGLAGEVFAAQRTQFYRNELRQPRNLGMVALGTGIAAVFFVALLLLGVMCCGLTAPFALAFPAMVFPGILVAESVLREFDDGTMETLLLTPADRNEILWSKFAARLRPMYYVSITVAVVLTVGGLCTGLLTALAEEGDGRDLVFWSLVGMLCGLTAGCVCGTLLLGQAGTGGALAIYSALTARSRTGSYMLMMAISGGICLLESLVMGVVLLLGIYALIAGISMGGDESALLTAALVFLGAVVMMLVRTVLVNWFLPIWLMRSCARRMDVMLLSGTSVQSA